MNNEWKISSKGLWDIERKVVEVQAYKIAKWGNSPCCDRTHSWNFENRGIVTRFSCPQCIKQFCKETGL
jgi:transposase-like protein